MAEAEARELEQTVLLHGAAVDGLTAFIRSHDLDRSAIEASFDEFSSSIADSVNAVRSVQIVDGTRIDLVHPIEGNEKAVGLDLFADERRRWLLQGSITSGATTLEVDRSRPGDQPGPRRTPGWLALARAHDRHQCLHADTPQGKSTRTYHAEAARARRSGNRELSFVSVRSDRVCSHDDRAAD